MEATPASVVIVRLETGWIAHVRYEDRLLVLDQDIACFSRFTLDRRIDDLFQSLMRRR